MQQWHESEASGPSEKVYQWEGQSCLGELAISAVISKAEFMVF